MKLPDQIFAHMRITEGMALEYGYSYA